MAEATAKGRAYWANVVAIVVGVLSFAFVMWAGPIASSEDTGDVVAFAGWAWLSYGIAAFLCLASLLLSTRSALWSKIALGLAGLTLIASAFTFAAAGWMFWFTKIIPGVACLAAAPFMGEMPHPHETRPT